MGTHKIRDELRTEIIKRPCMICRQREVDPAHVVAVGAGGPDRFFNIVPLCRRHHSEQHAAGWLTMLRKYRRLKLGLYLLGWKLENFVGKERLWHPDLQIEKQEKLGI